MSADDRILNSQQERALAALLLHGSPSRAAVQARVSERSVRRWSESEPFAAEYRRRARLLAVAAATDLMAAQGQAVAALRDALANGSAATKVRAARALLELGTRLWDDDTEARLLDLEREAQRWDGGKTFGLASTG